MTRVEELTFNLADGSLSDQEAAELEELLATDPAAAEAHLHLLGLEAALMAKRELPDLQARTIVRLREELAASVVQGVMQKVGALSPPAWAGRDLRGSTTEGQSAWQHIDLLLATLGKPIGLPWWAVNLTLYVATTVLFVACLDLEPLFPKGGLFSLLLGMLAEFGFATWMIGHLRRAREQAVVLANKVPSATERSAWLRRHLPRMCWRWIAIVLVLFYGIQFGLGLQAEAPDEIRKWLAPHLIWFVTNVMKTSMFMALFSHLGWLAGIGALVRGECSCSLNRGERDDLRSRTHKEAFRLTTVLGLCLGLWGFAHGYDYGFSFWSGGASVLLAAFLLLQLAVSSQTVGRLHDFFCALGQAVALFRALLSQPSADAVVALAAIFASVPLRFLGAAISR
jgi:hypothetical protein